MRLFGSSIDFQVSHINEFIHTLDRRRLKQMTDLLLVFERIQKSIKDQTILGKAFAVARVAVILLNRVDVSWTTFQAMRLIGSYTTSPLKSTGPLPPANRSLQLALILLTIIVYFFILIPKPSSGQITLPNGDQMVFLNAAPSPVTPGTENMLIITEGQGTEQSFLIVLPPSLTRNALGGGFTGGPAPRINPMVLRL
jgi:hypothetical protein